MLGSAPEAEERNGSTAITERHRDTDEADGFVSFHPGFSSNNASSRDPYTTAALAATPQASALRNRRGDSSQGLTPLLLNTASAARGRRRDGGVSGNNENGGDKASLNIVNPKPRPRNRPHRAASELALNVAAMEEVHGVDVSWLHHTNKGTALE